MLQLLKKVLVFLVSGSISIIFAACYGIDTDLQYTVFVKIRDSRGAPIQGLKLELLENNAPIESTHTDLNGETGFLVSLQNGYNYTLAIDDIDAEANGGIFKSKEVSINTTTDVYDIIIEYQE